MQFIDLKSQYKQIEENVKLAVNKVLDHGMYVGGPEITELEEKLADYCGSKYALACSSGTDALLIPMLAMGLRKGDAVFCPSFTFVATAEVSAMLGIKPVFVDIDLETFNMSPQHLEESIKYVIEKTDLNPKLVMPVDLFGLPANYDEIQKIADKYNLKILEDAAQGFGGKIGKKVAGSFGQAAGTSFYPAKPLGAYGDAGACFTDSEELIEIFRSIRVHGMGGERYDNIRIGINGRMSTIQAAILLEKFKIFDNEIKQRNIVASRYNKLLAGKIKTPKVNDNYTSTWAQYTVIAESNEHRTSLMDKLKSNGVPVAVFYPKPCHQQTAYKNYCHIASKLENSEYAAERVFSLPMHPYLEEEDQIKIAELF
ncbi:DegT/DnrJ/EryC1/StrS aminotransferase family protein [Candidatus Kapabacteria bacterium]|nr:DegT/DnrJ/EryC1/StrS aminotransferase family protein [Candidatus Kapabacteria bacterium]